MHLRGQEQGLMSRFSIRSWKCDHSELHKRRACFCRSGENAVSTDGMAAEATRGRDAGEGQQATKALTRLARQDTQWTAAAAHGRAQKPAFLHCPPLDDLRPKLSVRGCWIP